MVAVSMVTQLWLDHEKDVDTLENEHEDEIDMGVDDGLLALPND